MTAHPSKVDVQALEAFFAALRQSSEDLGARLSRFFEQFELQLPRFARDTRAANTPHLDVLCVFGLEFKELRHSDALAWFLNPNAEHEQGPLFANALLCLVGVAPVGSENYSVLRERHERTDVALYAQGKFAVFIENKVRHWERDEQVSDMVNSLAKLGKHLSIPTKRRFAIFLTDTGATPVTGPSNDSPEFLVDNLFSLRRVQIFESFRGALIGTHTHSPLLMNLIDSYLDAIRRLRSRIH